MESARAAATSAPTSAPPLRPRDDLVQVRAGAWRLLVPMSAVERVHGAALPALQPRGGGPPTPVVGVGGALVPVIFAAALLGAEEVSLQAADQMLLLRAGEDRVLLWVDAVEEVVEHAPVPAPSAGAAAGLACAWSGAERPLAVLDVPRLAALACGRTAPENA